MLCICVKAFAHNPIFCRWTADFLSRSNRVKICRTFRLPHTSRGLGPSHPKSRWRLFHWRDSYDIFYLVEVREPRQIVFVHRTLANKARQDVFRSRIVRYRLTSPDLVAGLNSLHTSRQVKIFCRPTKNRLVCGDFYKSMHISLPFSAKQRREMTKFDVFWRARTAMANFSYLL